MARRGIIVRGSFQAYSEPVEFLWIGGSVPYLRIGLPRHKVSREEYVGCIDGRAGIRKLRDYLTKCLGRPARRKK